MIQKSKKSTFFAIVISLSLLIISASASPACDFPREHIQPDGSVVEIYTYGDENYNFEGDSEGYLLEKNENGEYAYVVSGEDLAPVASDEAGLVRPANAVKGFDLAPKTVDNTIDAEPLDEDYLASLTDKAAAATGTVFENSLSYTHKALGDRKLLVVVVDYNDIQVDTSKLSNAQINKNFFSTTSGVASVANYFKEQSKSMFSFVPAFKMSEVGASAADGKAVTDADTTDTYGAVADGVIKVKVDADHPNDSAGGGFVLPSVAVVDEYVDFAQFDFNQDKAVLSDEVTFFFLVAGYEGSTGKGLTPAIWGHSTNKKYTTDDTIDGTAVTVLATTEAKYASTGAMYDTSRGFGIGTMCHELGHTLFLTDYYNTTNKKARYGFVTEMSLMDSGGWGRKTSGGMPGSYPTGLDAFSKLYLGWYDQTNDLLVVDENHKGTYGLVSHYSTTEPDPSKGLYRFILIRSSNDPTEYYILENRLFKGHDVGLKYYTRTPTQAGVAIWRVDESKFNKALPSSSRPNNTIEAGMKFMHCGATVAGTNSDATDTLINTLDAQGISYTSTASPFYAYSKPFWFKGTNKFSFFGEQSYPNNQYVTPLSGLIDTSSGVAVEFLSDAGADIAMVKLGANAIDELVYTSNGSTKMYVFNNTDADASTIPFIAEYTDDALTNLISYGRLSLSADSYSTTSAKTFAFDDAKDYSTLCIDLPTLKPYYTAPAEPEPENEFLPGVEQSLSFSLNTTGVLSKMSVDATVMKDAKVQFVKPIPASGNTIVYYNNQIEITDGIEDVGTYVALPVTNKGENAFTAVEYSGTTPVKKSAKIVVTGENLLSVSKDSSTTSTTWPAETVYAGYLAEDSGATAEQIATAQKLYGYVDGAATRIPSQGTSSASSAITVDFTTVDYGYYNLDLYINGTLSSATPWFLRFGNNYWRVRSTDNHILLDSTDTGVALAADEWQSVLLMLDGTDVDIYINGILAGKGCVDFNVTSIKMWEGSTKPANEANLYEDRASFERGTKNIE